LEIIHAESRMERRLVLFKLAQPKRVIENLGDLPHAIQFSSLEFNWNGEARFDPKTLGENSQL
jgi:hypothetical protein